MALEINAQYAKFVQFAQQQENAAASKAIARAGDDAGALAGRTITAAGKDRVAPMWRSEANKRANDFVREIFRQSVADIFGGDDKIPQSVKDAMLLKDYGKGKPLTARRIIAVKTAVDDVLRRVAPALAQAKTAAASLYIPGEGDLAPELLRAKVDSLLETLVRATAIDKDALDIAVANGRRILIKGDSSLRTEEEVREKAEKLLASIAELKQAAGGNRAIFEAGKAFLVNMCGKNIPEGFMRDMVAAAKNLKIGNLKKLSPSSSGMAIHRAVCEFADNVNKTLFACGAQSKLDGADENVAARDFAAALLLARCSDSQARGVVAAVASGNAGLLNDLYEMIGNWQFEKEGFTPGLVDHIAAQGSLLLGMFSQLNIAAQTRIGRPQEQIARIPAAPNANYDAIDGSEIFDLVTDRARKAAAAHKADFIRKSVAGEGPVADVVRKAYSRFGGPEGFDLPAKLRDARNEILRNMINVNLCEECKNLATNPPETSQFALDRHRGIDVSLPGGEKLSADFATARNQLASFATNGAKKTYEALDPAEKGKVHVMMALLNQKSAIAAQNAGALVLDPDGRNNAIQFAGENQPETALEIAFDEYGNLNVKCRMKTERLTMIDVVDAGGKTVSAENPGPDTKVEASFTLKIKPGELERLASVDYAAYDNAAVDARLLDHNVKNPYSDLNGTLGGNFKFKTSLSEVKCLSEYKVTVA